MKFSFSELERARKEPKKFAASKLKAITGFRSTFPMYWILAAKYYHKLRATNNPNAKRDTLRHFTQQCQEKLSLSKGFNSKLLQYGDQLDAYITSYESLNYPFVKTNKRVEFRKIHGNILSGRIDRIDINPAGGYVATNFEATASDWETRLRIPITQRALAEEFGCPASEIQVGMFCIESAKHSYVTLPDSDINSAVSEVGTVLNSVETELRILRTKAP